VTTLFRLSAHQLNNFELSALVRIDTGDAIGHYLVLEECLLKPWNLQNLKSMLTVKRTMDK